MKTFYSFFSALLMLTVVASCGGGAGSESGMAKLEKLKAQQAEINAQIATLEAELKTGSDSTQQSASNFMYVEVSTVEPTLFAHAIDVQGRVEASENITLLPRAQGPITKIHVQAGQQVKAGQIIAEINNDIAKAQVNDLKTNLALVNQIYEKQKNLWEQKVGSEVQYLQAKTNKESLEAKLEQAREMLEMHYYKSPINGVVDDMPLKIGQLVSPAAPMQSGVRIVNLGKLKVKADLSESYSGSVKEGQKVNLLFPDIQRKSESRISYAEKVINPLTRTFGVEVMIQPDAIYRSNMIARLSIVDYANSAAIVAPINTIQLLDDHKVVFIASQDGNDFVARKVEVTTGMMYNGKVEILSGLKQGDKLITTGYQELNEGEKVRF